MNHLDLFSGIGGFSLAFDNVFHEQENTHTFVEIDPFCRAVLKKHWPEAEIIGDIRAFATDPVGSRHLHGKSQKLPTEPAQQAQRQSPADILPPFILTGGFPCQPFSQAGRRKGTEDDRHLWPEMLRVIRATQPQWVVAENVRGILTIGGGMVFEQVCADLEGAGYEVQPLVIPAVAKNAPHRRDRVWFIAHARGGEHRRRRGQEGETEGVSGLSGKEGHVWRISGTDKAYDATNTRYEHGSKGRNERMETDKAKRTSRKPDLERRSEDATDTERERHEGEVNQTGQSTRHHRRPQSPDWSTDWLKVSREFCGVYDGISDWVHRHYETVISKKDYGREIERNGIEELRALWQAVQSEPIQERVGGILALPEKEALLPLLLNLQRESINTGEPVESKEDTETESLRNLWHSSRPTLSSQRRRLHEQRAKQLVDIVPKLSCEVARNVAEIADYINHAWSAINPKNNRNPRLKALGNAIVSQVAEEIFRSIKYAESIR